MIQGSDDTELLRVQRERDELQGLLDKFERHMAEVSRPLVEGFTFFVDSCNYITIRAHVKGDFANNIFLCFF